MKLVIENPRLSGRMQNVVREKRVCANVMRTKYGIVEESCMEIYIKEDRRVKTFMYHRENEMNEK